MTLLLLILSTLGPDKQAERERVKLELAKFQQVFYKAGSGMGSYQRKKYVCKILYIFMLGYRVDIGRKEAVQLCGAKKFSEKQVVRIMMPLNSTCKIKSND